MTPFDDPFAVLNRELEACPLREAADAIVVDFHCEASSEKQGIGFFCDGRASLVVGTHTHVPTADHQILPGGTAYMTDAGMTGDYNSIIGMQKEEPLRRFTSGIPSGRFEPALGVATLSGVAVETDDATGLALKDRAGADRRQARAGAAGILGGVDTPEHDPEKWKPVFRKIMLKQKLLRDALAANERWRSIGCSSA